MPPDETQTPNQTTSTDSPAEGSQTQTSTVTDQQTTLTAPETSSSVEPTGTPAAGSESSTKEGSSKVLMIPTDAMGAIKREEREKGKKQAYEELETRAKAAGFESWAAMETALKALPKPSTKPAPEPPSAVEEAKPKADEPDPEKIRLQQEALEAKQKAEQEAKQNQKLRNELLKQQAQNDLKLAAISAGVKDVDYALTLLKRELKGKSAEELQSFDEKKFFSETLRSSHPYLYAIEERPATTASGGANGAPPPPSKGKEPIAPTNGAVDARTLSRQEFDELLRKRGITPPQVGGPS
jgi:hypothetical protein